MSCQFLRAFEAGNEASIKEMLKQNPEYAERPDRNYDFPIHYAIRYGLKEILRVLLFEYYVCPNYANKDDEAPIHYAAKYSNRAMLDILLSNDDEIFIDMDDKDKNTALHLACRRGHYEIAELLLEKGADPNFKNRYGNTPLHFAATSRNLSLLCLLVFKGGNPCAINGEEQAPIDLLNPDKLKTFSMLINVDSILEIINKEVPQKEDTDDEYNSDYEDEAKDEADSGHENDDENKNEDANRDEYQYNGGILISCKI